MKRAVRWAMIAVLFGASAAHADSWSEKRPNFGTPGGKSSTPERGASRRKQPAPAPSTDTWKAPGALLDNDILLGLKGGPQFVSFTDINQNGQSVPVQNGTGYAFGGAFFWNVGLPSLEADIFMHNRQQGGRTPVSYVGIPLLVKFVPAENRRLSWNIGSGIQTDLAVSGAGTRRNVLIGMPVATDLLIRLNVGLYLDFETRYVFGLQTYDGGTTGGRPRDLDILVGLLLPIDRSGF